MIEMLAVSFWLLLAGYAAVGAVVAGWMLTFALKRVDHNAAIAPFYVKALWVPGLITLWPLVLLRAAGVRPPEDRG